MLRELDVLASDFGVSVEQAPLPSPESFVAAEPEPEPVVKKYPIDRMENADVGRAVGRVPLNAEVEVSGDGGAITNTQVVVDGVKHFAGADQLSTDVQVGTKPRQKKASARAGKRAMKIEGEGEGEGEGQEGVVLATFSKPTMKTEVTDSAAARREAIRLDNKVAGKKTKFVVEVAPEDEDEVVATVVEEAALRQLRARQGSVAVFIVLLDQSRKRR